jgi:hypothetical protein
MGGIERGASFPRSTMMGERERGKMSQPAFGEEGRPYIGPPMKFDRYSHSHRLKPALAGQTGYFWTKIPTETEGQPLDGAAKAVQTSYFWPS